MRKCPLLIIVLIGSCSLQPKAFDILVGSTTRPAVEVHPGAVQLGPTTQPALNIILQHGAIQVDAPITSPAVPESTGKSAGWALIILAVGVVFWAIPSPLRALRRWTKRGNHGRQNNSRSGEEDHRG